jgi:penicillin amidase
VIGLLLPTLVWFANQKGFLSRDSFGVPHIQAPTIGAAWEADGFAAAQDRMWQMETSRHLARGTLASILGPSALASDTEVAKSGYTTAELQKQFDKLSSFAKNAMTGYAIGVNRFLRTQPLSAEFGENQDRPAPWTTIDSVAICVRLFQEFGRGGAGELRNLAFIQYAKLQPKLRGRVLDALDDFAWQNNPAAVTTLSAVDDPSAKHPPVIFRAFDRSVSEARLKEIPLPSLFELLPAIQLAEREDSHLLAESVAAPFRTGSYCVVVSPKRSATGNALLLSGPQMGFTTPSVLHEVSISAPGLRVSGADVPGIPGVVVGKTDQFAWGLTSGVADTEDIVWSRSPSLIVSRPVTIQVKGDAPVTVASKWTEYGPVVLSNANAVFSRHSAYRDVELRSFDALLSTYGSRSAAEIDRAIRPATMNFNYFFATVSGDIGYRYLGRIPLRAPGLDPRLPTPGGAEYAWRGFVPVSQMPHVINPKSGLLANWNNKPTAWWPNGDTPVWGRIFEANSLFDELHRPKFSSGDLAGVVKSIAQKAYTWPFFREYSPAFDGRSVDGSPEAGRYERWFEELRRELIVPVAGSFLSPDVFRLVAQPTLVWNALHGKTKLDFLGGRTVDEIVAAATRVADGGSEPYHARGPSFGSLGSMPYGNRGTYIQIVELSRSGITGRSVLPPGESADGSHAGDQLPLANGWSFKPMGG